MGSEMLAKYRLSHRLAEGGMAEIFLGSLSGVEGFSKDVVVKRILPHLARDPEFLSMFVDEAKLAAQLLHPNIVQVHELGSADGHYYIAMEYVAGCNLATLRDLLWQANETLPLRAALTVAAEVLRALDYAHDKRGVDGQPLHIVHRDVSPQNILLSHEGMVKLADFGIAKARTRSTKTDTGQVRGKFSYMSPEQATGQPLDRRADVFSFAVVLYELLASRRLYASDDELATLDRARRADIPHVVEVAPHLPKPLAEVLTRALAADREARFPTAGAFADALVAASWPAVMPLSAAEMAQLISRFASELPRPVALESSATTTSPGESTTPAATTTPAAKTNTRRGRGVYIAAAVLTVVGAAFVARPWLASPITTASDDVSRPSLPAPTPEAHPATPPPATSQELATPTPPAQQAPAPTTSAPTRPAPPKAPAPGYLTLNSKPWSYVTVDGRKLEETTPIVRLRLSAGRHAIRLHAPSLGKERQLDVDIEPGKTLTRVVLFDP